MNEGFLPAQPVQYPAAPETVSTMGDAISNFLEYANDPVHRNVRIGDLPKIPAFNALTSALFFGCQYMEGRLYAQAELKKQMQENAAQEVSDESK